MATNNVNLNELTAIDLRKEYGHSYVGEYAFAIVSELTLDALESTYGQVLEHYRPFVIISPAIYSAILDSHKESERTRIAEIAHPSVPLELAETIFIDELDAPPIICESGIALEFIVNEMMSLPDRQGSRIYKRYILGYTSKEISAFENAALVSVFESLRDAKAAMRNVFAELGLGGNKNG